MRDRLPPLNALRAFEAAARHLSFTKAAEELHVTPAAVSHQVKGLEEITGAKLFHRMTRSLRLTKAGEAALTPLSRGLDLVAEGAGAMRSHADTHELRISVSASFGALWLIPRLDGFRRLHPDIEVRIDGTDRRVDIRHGEADAAVRYGPGGYPSLCVDRLFGQRNTPVCSPELTQKPPGLRQPEDLAHQTLLHIDWKDAEASWRMWLLAAGLEDIDPMRGPQFSQESMAVEAALDGQGVALVGDRLIGDHLKTGRLVRPFDQALSTPLSFSYYLLTDPADDRPKTEAFRTWMLSEAAERDVDTGS